MKWMAAAALMLAPVLAWAQTGTCPALKNPDLKWNQRQGDNYTLCYIELPGSVSTGFGIYVGHRTFKPDKKAKAEKGAVGTQQVQWYTKATPGNARPYSREAMIVIPGDKPKSKLKVYTWIDAATAEQLNQATAIAKQVALN